MGLPEILIGDAASVHEVFNVIVQRHVGHQVGGLRHPGDIDAQVQQFVVGQRRVHEALHYRERSLHGLPGPPGLVNISGSRELYPVYPANLFVGLHPVQGFGVAAVGRFSGIALGNDHKVGVQLPLAFHGRLIPGQDHFQGLNLHAGRAGTPLSFDGLVVDADAGDALFDAVLHHAPYRHDAAVAGVTVQNDWETHGPGDPAGDQDTLAEGGGPHVLQAGIGAHHAAGAHEPGLRPSGFHNPGQGGAGWVHHAEHPVSPPHQLLQLGGCFLVGHDSANLTLI